MCACGEGEETPLHVFTQRRQFQENRTVAPLDLEKEESRTYLVGIVNKLWSMEREGQFFIEIEEEE